MKKALARAIIDRTEGVKDKIQNGNTIRPPKIFITDLIYEHSKSQTEIHFQKLANEKCELEMKNKDEV